MKLQLSGLPGGRVAGSGQNRGCFDLDEQVGLGKGRDADECQGAGQVRLEAVCRSAAPSWMSCHLFGAQSRT